MRITLVGPDECLRELARIAMCVMDKSSIGGVSQVNIASLIAMDTLYKLL